MVECTSRNTKKKAFNKDFLCVGLLFLWCQTNSGVKQDCIGAPVCVCVFICVSICVFSVFRIVNEPLRRPAWRQVLISCTVQTAGKVYTKYTRLFSLASATNRHEGPGLLLDLSCLLIMDLHQPCWLCRLTWFSLDGLDRYNIVDTCLETISIS